MNVSTSVLDIFVEHKSQSALLTFTLRLQYQNMPCCFLDYLLTSIQIGENKAKSITLTRTHTRTQTYLIYIYIILYFSTIAILVGTNIMFGVFLYASFMNIQ